MSIDKLYQSLMYSPTGKPEYDAKMMHLVPDVQTVDRNTAILKACKDRVVLDVGSAGSGLHDAIKVVAKKAYGVDQANADFICNLDKDPMPKLADIELVVCGEVIEHLSNPGFFLDNLRSLYKCEVIFTVPNAFSSIGTARIASGYENVNNDHVAWYSWKTFTTLLQRHRFNILTFWWYGGLPRYSEDYYS